MSDSITKKTVAAPQTLVKIVEALVVLYSRAGCIWVRGLIKEIRQ